MNRILEAGIANANLRRQAAANKGVRGSTSPEVQATSQRFFEVELGEAGENGISSRTFGCQDKTGFLDRIGASASVREALEEATLRVVLLEQADNPGGRRHGSLIAEYPSSPSTSPFDTRPDLLFSFRISRPGEETDSLGALVLSMTTDPIDYTKHQVQPGSIEHQDMKAIADFFLPDVAGN